MKATLLNSQSWRKLDCSKTSCITHILERSKVPHTTCISRFPLLMWIPTRTKHLHSLHKYCTSNEKQRLESSFSGLTNAFQFVGWSSAKRIKTCSVQFWPPKEKMIESEIRKYACCTANLKAATVFSIISIILDVVALVLAIIFISVPAWNNSDHLNWDFVVST